MRRTQRQAGVYAITNKKTGRAYIGASMNVRQRWVEHKNLLCKNKHYNKALQADWNECGENGFDFKVLEAVPEDCSNRHARVYLEAREWYYIKSQKNRYNVWNFSTRRIKGTAKLFEIPIRELLRSLDELQ